jgi:hypothetical protein
MEETLTALGATIERFNPDRPREEVEWKPEVKADAKAEAKAEPPLVETKPVKKPAHRADQPA